MSTVNINKYKLVVYTKKGDWSWRLLSWQAGQFFFFNFEEFICTINHVKVKPKGVNDEELTIYLLPTKPQTQRSTQQEALDLQIPMKRGHLRRPYISDTQAGFSEEDESYGASGARIVPKLSNARPLTTIPTLGR